MWGRHRKFMELALEQAKKAELSGDIPVGCVVVKDNEVIARGFNTREADKDVLGHAEINALREACRAVGDWRLTGCTVYVTLEPCPMCMGAILNARPDLLVFGATDFRAGCGGGLVNFNSMGFANKVEILAGICEEESQAVLNDFFSSIR